MNFPPIVVGQQVKKTNRTSFPAFLTSTAEYEMDFLYVNKIPRNVDSRRKNCGFNFDEKLELVKKKEKPRLLLLEADRNHDDYQHRKEIIIACCTKLLSTIPPPSTTQSGRRTEGEEDSQMHRGGLVIMTTTASFSSCCNLHDDCSQESRGQFTYREVEDA